MKDATVIAPVQQATLVIVMIAETATTSQSLMTASAKIIFLTIMTTQGLPLVTLKTQIMNTAITYMMMTCGKRNRKMSPLLSHA